MSFSGSPGGLFLFITQMESGVNEKGVIDNYFKKHYGVDSALSPDCEIIYRDKTEHARPMVDVFYLKTNVQSIDEMLLKKSLENKKDKNRLRSILRDYRDDRVWNGFDAILFYNKDNEVINFYGLSALDKTLSIQKSSISATDVLDDKKLGLAICKAIAQLPTPAP